MFSDIKLYTSSKQYNLTRKNKKWDVSTYILIIEKGNKELSIKIQCIKIRMSDSYVSVLDIYMYVQISPISKDFEHFQDLCFELFIANVSTKIHCSLFTHVCQLPLSYYIPSTHCVFRLHTIFTIRRCSTICIVSNIGNLRHIYRFILYGLYFNPYCW